MVAKNIDECLYIGMTQASTVPNVVSLLSLSRPQRGSCPARLRQVFADVGMYAVCRQSTLAMWGGGQKHASFGGPTCNAAHKFEDAYKLSSLLQ